jgi:pyruvate dehydrogenase E2 component (dihydrolipoamide acetyltransferase)
VIAQRLTQSVQTAPQFRLVVDLRADNMLALRSQIAEKNNAKVSLNDVLIKAAAHALLTVPEVNIHVLGDRVRYFKEANISVAVTTDGGLMTPVVHGANRKGILDIAAETRSLTAQAREGRLSAEAVSGGTFTISNLGMFGIRQFDAIINPPQGAILAVGATQRCRVLLEDGTEVVATMLTVTLSCDHRAIDGALGARFLQALRGFVENPDRVPA